MTDRRRLLKAAAAAPVIATLPATVGVALANGSAHGCMVRAAGATADGFIDHITENPDQYMRILAHRRTCKDGDFFLVAGKWRNVRGEEVRTPSQGPAKRLASDKETHVLITFKPDNMMTEVERIEVNFDGIPDGTTALTGSCWTSVAPGSNLEGFS